MAKAKPRKREDAYWADVRADALKLIEHVGGPSAEEVKAKILNMMTTQDQAARDAQTLSEIATTIETKRKALGITRES